MRRSITLASHAALIVLLPQAPVLAEEHCEETIEITIAGRPEAVSRAEAVFTELLDPLQVTPWFTRGATIDPREFAAPRAEAEPSLTRIWIALDDDSSAFIYLIDPREHRVLVRQVDLVQGIDAVALEEIGQILSASVEALLSGEPLPGGAEPVEIAQGSSSHPSTDAHAEPPSLELMVSPVLPPPRPDMRRHRLGFGIDLGLGYSMAIWSADQAPLQGVESFVGLVFRHVRLVPEVRVSLTYRLPNQVELPAIRAHHDQLELRFAAGIEPFRSHSRSRRVAIRVILGGGLDIIGVDPRRSEAPDELELELEQRSRLVIAMLRVQLEVRVRLAGALVMLFALGVDIDLMDLEYTITRETVREVVFDPFAARPLLLIALAKG